MQTNNLQIAPEGVMPIVHASQYDFGREIKFYLYDGSTAYTPPVGSTINVEGIKSDGNAFSYECTWSGNQVTFELTQQMTVLAETVTCELRIIDSTDMNIGTLNFKLQVEKSPIDGDTPVSETEIPAIIELAQAQADLAVESAKDSEAWAVGQREGTDVPSTDPTYHNNAKYYAGQTSDDVTAAQNAAKDSEAYAVGKRNGVDVGSSDPAYHNNAKYYTGEASTSATNAGNSATSAGADALVAEGYAAGSQNGTPVSSGTYYQNNSKYYKEQAANSATSASGSATSANGSAEDSEAWSQGTRNGTPVGSSDPTYENNAKYWAAQASGAVNDMTGATALTPGAHGLVPAPAAGDQNKYLKGDGTWGSLGTAAAKNSTNAVTQNSTDLVESGAVYSEIASVNSALSNKANSADVVPNTDMSTITRTGTSNSGTKIEVGTYFYLNGILSRAIADIDNGATFTEGTNFNKANSGDGALNSVSYRYKTVATAAANQTYAQQLALLTSAYNALSKEERENSQIRIGGGTNVLKYNTGNNYSRLTLNSSATPENGYGFFVINPYDKTYQSQSLKDGNVTNRASTNNSSTLNLEVLEIY